MNETPVPYYAFSLDGRQIVSIQVDPASQRRGPNCPFELDLLNLAQGQIEEELRTDLEMHLTSCPACTIRFDAMRRVAVRADADFSFDTPSLLKAEAAPRSQRFHSWEGYPELVSAAAGGEVGQHKWRVHLIDKISDLPAWNLILYTVQVWGSPENSRVALFFPLRTNGTSGNEESCLRRLDGQSVELRLWQTGVTAATLRTQLHWMEGEGVISHPEEIPLEQPSRLERIEFIPGS